MVERRSRPASAPRWFAVGIRKPDPGGVFFVRQIAVEAWSAPNAEYRALLDHPGCRASVMLACPREGFPKREEAEALITHADWTAWP